MTKHAVSATAASATSRQSVAGIGLIVFCSGFAGLGYEIVWSRMLAVALGHEIIAVLAVLAAFFTGLAIGAFVFNPYLRNSTQAHRWYAFLELIIALWALALAWLIPYFNQLLPLWIGTDPSQLKHWGIAFGATLGLLLPGTAAMGATLPALEQVYTHQFGPGRYVGGIYAANTFGAVAGTLFITFVLAPHLRYQWIMGLCAAINLCCAAGILSLVQNSANGSLTTQDGTNSTRLDGNRLMTTLFITGFLSLSYEVLVIRALSQVLEDTIYSFALVLSIYLLGTACGGAIYQRFLANRSVLLSPLLVFTSAACLTGAASLWLADASYELLYQQMQRTGGAAMMAEMILAIMVFLLPTITMGMLFSHLVQEAKSRYGLGRLLSINTLGSSLGPFVAGILLLPAIGSKSALLVVSSAYLTLLPDLRRQTLKLAMFPVMLAGLMVLLPPLRFVTIPEGGRLLDFREGIMASVAVVDDYSGTRYLKVNNHFTMGSTSSFYADHRQTHIPLLLHKAPNSALFLGVGTGMSLNAAQYHPQLEVTAVELVPEVLAQMSFFGTAPHQNDWSKQPLLVASDARRFILSSRHQYDVIIADLFHPSRDGAGSLYTSEHFAAIKKRLAPDGLFCQWLPLFQMDLNTFKLIARSFLEQFPYVQVHLPHFSLRQPIIGLIGSNQPLRYADDWLLNRVHYRPLQRQLVSLRLNSDLALFGSFISDGNGLDEFVGPGELNTDDRPLVTYRAPEFAYQQRQGHDQRLLTLIDALGPTPNTIIDISQSNQSEQFANRLAAYWLARNAYLKAGLGVSPSNDVSTMLNQIREPLLNVIRISDEFTPAYVPLLSMAEALAEYDNTAARRLLMDIKLAAPNRNEASQLYRQLFIDQENRP